MMSHDNGAAQLLVTTENFGKGREYYDMIILGFGWS